jgi:hypothetical protein
MIIVILNTKNVKNHDIKNGTENILKKIRGISLAEAKTETDFKNCS